MNLVIDIGNTQTKYALIDYGKITHQKTVSKLFPTDLKKILKTYKVSISVVSTVQEKPTNLIQVLESTTTCIVLDHETPVNFNNLYKTPQTLGLDRIALVAAAQHEFPENNVLIIDAGTCITFDFKDANGQYLGGAISPGIDMRFKALNHFTHKLPLVKNQDLTDFIGDTTTGNILSGVLNGTINEVEGVINQYHTRFEGLKIVVTGGNQDFFAKYLKNDFFARPYFLLIGLNAIANINA